MYIHGVAEGSQISPPPSKNEKEPPKPPEEEPKSEPSKEEPKPAPPKPAPPKPVIPKIKVLVNVLSPVSAGKLLYIETEGVAGKLKPLSSDTLSSFTKLFFYTAHIECPKPKEGGRVPFSIYTLEGPKKKKIELCKGQAVVDPETSNTYIIGERNNGHSLSFESAARMLAFVMVHKRVLEQSGLKEGLAGLHKTFEEVMQLFTKTYGANTPHVNEIKRELGEILLKAFKHHRLPLWFRCWAVAECAERYSISSDQDFPRLLKFFATWPPELEDNFSFEKLVRGVTAVIDSLLIRGLDRWPRNWRHPDIIQWTRKLAVNLSTKECIEAGGGLADTAKTQLINILRNTECEQAQDIASQVQWNAIHERNTEFVLRLCIASQGGWSSNISKAINVQEYTTQTGIQAHEHIVTICVEEIDFGMRASKQLPDWKAMVRPLSALLSQSDRADPSLEVINRAADTLQGGVQELRRRRRNLSWGQDPKFPKVEAGAGNRVDPGLLLVSQVITGSMFGVEQLPVEAFWDWIELASYALAHGEVRKDAEKRREIRDIVTKRIENSAVAQSKLSYCLKMLFRTQRDAELQKKMMGVMGKIRAETLRPYEFVSAILKQLSTNDPEITQCFLDYSELLQMKCLEALVDRQDWAPMASHFLKQSRDIVKPDARSRFREIVVRYCIFCATRDASRSRGKKSPDFSFNRSIKEFRDLRLISGTPAQIPTPELFASAELWKDVVVFQHNYTRERDGSWPDGLLSPVTQCVEALVRSVLDESIFIQTVASREFRQNSSTSELKELVDKVMPGSGAEFQKKVIELGERVDKLEKTEELLLRRLPGLLRTETNTFNNVGKDGWKKFFKACTGKEYQGTSISRIQQKMSTIKLKAGESALASKISQKRGVLLWASSDKSPRLLQEIEKFAIMMNKQWSRPLDSIWKHALESCQNQLQPEAQADEASSSNSSSTGAGENWIELWTNATNAFGQEIEKVSEIC